MIKRVSVNLPDIVGRGYGTFWRYEGRYRVCKGSRASKKSKTTALNFIYRIMKHPQANLLVVRKTFRTLKDSCFTDLKWAIKRLQVDDYWETKTSPLEITYKPTGQKILFRGLDDPLKITSITVDVGYLCWGWIEEAYEITSEADFDVLDESIRGDMPEGLFKQWTLTFNPWNEHHWLKKRFFDVESPDVLAMTTDYRCNEWLDAADLRLFEEMKSRNPRRYQVAGLGNWGIVDGLVFENWEERAFTLEEVKECVTCCGLDFGYTNDPTAFSVAFLNQKTKELYVWDEIYQTGMSNRDIADRIQSMGYGKERIVADSAEPKSIDELKGYGLRVRGAKKGRDSVRHGIQWMQDLRIYIHPRCVNALVEFGNYTWKKDRFGKALNEPEDEFNHYCDSLRYACEKYIARKTWVM